MTTTGIILWSLAIGLLVLGVMRNKGAKTDENQEAAHKQHKGGCCG